MQLGIATTLIRNLPNLTSGLGDLDFRKTLIHTIIYLT